MLPTGLHTRTRTNMKLHWSPRSPYVRKVMIAAHEMGLGDRLDCVRTVVSPFAPAEELWVDNPLNKLPTLVLDDGLAIFDNRVICEYLDTLHEGAKLFPAGGRERLIALRNQALGDGLLDVLMMRLIERLRPEEKRSTEIVESNERKTKATLDRLETDIELLTARPHDIGHVAIGTALGYADFRFAVDNWREGRPKLAAWHAGFVERPAVLACPVRDDS
jgi:glutathione S-transferase